MFPNKLTTTNNYFSIQSSSDLATIHDKLVQALLLYREEYGSHTLPDLDADASFVGMHFICLGDMFQIP